MQLTDEEIERYQKIATGISGTKLSKAEAVQQGKSVVEFFSILIDIDKRIKKEASEKST